MAVASIAVGFLHYQHSSKSVAESLSHFSKFESGHQVFELIFNNQNEQERSILAKEYSKFSSPFLTTRIDGRQKVFGS
ncbi:MAG: hypothetical protein KME43_10370 [Myxacorys chilensis ATA2-1-KO14]|jgi:hypothetical protein|nr:hypothetical protein [Myxacorys chilensis ATA2-1-KO14]